MSFRSLGLTFRMNDYTVGQCVSSVVDAIWKHFSQLHLPVPDQKMFEEIAAGFQERWNFIHAIGCIDGKHIRIKCPKESGTMFYNYKHFFSIVLQAVADYRCRFIFVDVGGYGKQSDGGTFYASYLSTFLENCRANLPPPSYVEGIVTDMPFVILGDDAYPLKTYLMKPYSKRFLSYEEKVFNYRLSRARRCVECAFGIMCAKWRLLGKCIETDVNKAEKIVKCICLLHNIIINREGNDFNSAALQDSLNESPLQRSRSARTFNRSTRQAQIIRDTLKSYYNGIGAVPWQNERVQ
ncbi:hypothetical protein J437_LFUL018003 [Ladona fulva]|uniref:DDE Tnp4 domain-containing protein n=1 Tax=Ladona fulva TaxID=123851 RepID=A0A8K0PAV2_LADFU|nr:hypothetical protein J437_LFUL018003 [Ladona fulva]